MISFAMIRDRIEPMRTDKLAREAQLAYQIAARRLANESMALQEIVTFTVAAGARVASVYALVDEKEAVFILKAEKQETPGSYSPLEPLNARLLREGTLKLQFDSGVLSAFVSKDGKFEPFQPPSVDTQVRALVAYKPVGDFDEVDFSSESEDVLVDGALSHLFRLPGTQQNVKLAEIHEEKFLSGADNLRGITLVGDTEYARASGTRRRLGNGWGKLRW